MCWSHFALNLAISHFFPRNWVILGHYLPKESFEDVMMKFFGHEKIFHEKMIVTMVFTKV
jgi:hypothetical protein